MCTRHNIVHCTVGPNRQRAKNQIGLCIVIPENIRTNNVIATQFGRKKTSVVLQYPQFFAVEIYFGFLKIKYTKIVLYNDLHVHI